MSTEANHAENNDAEAAKPKSGRGIEYQLVLSPEEAAHGCQKTITYRRLLPDGSYENYSLKIPIPPGIKNGAKARFKGKGASAFEGSPSGHLYLHILIESAATPETKIEADPSLSNQIRLEDTVRADTSTLFEDELPPRFPALDKSGNDELAEASLRLESKPATITKTRLEDTAPGGSITPPTQEQTKNSATRLEPPTTGTPTQPRLKRLKPQTTQSSTQPKNQAQTWQPDAVIAGIYEVKALIGQGGMGAVHRVYHRQWQMDLAVKTPSEKMLQIAGGRERFQEREAREWVQLGLHPNITSCYYVRTLDDGIPRIFIEYVDGGSLAEWLKQGRIAGIKTALDIGIQICWGLAHAHQRGLAHRDIKPANILMTAAGTPKVTDFGLVKPVGESTLESGGIVAINRKTKAQETPNATLLAGTPGYAAPEQWTGKGMISEAVDVYAVGAMLYEMLTPLLGLTWYANALPQIWGQLFTQALNQGQPIDCPITGAAWTELVNVLTRCLAVQPEERYPNASALAEALQALHFTITGQTYVRTRRGNPQILADSLNNQAVSLLDLGHQEEAMLLWAQALETQVDHSEATYNQGLLLWRTGRMTGSDLIDRLRDVVVLRPQEWLPPYLLALVYLEQGEQQAALKILEVLKASLPNKAETTMTQNMAQHAKAFTAPVMLCRGTSGEVITRYEQALADAHRALSKEAVEVAAIHIRHARALPGLRREPQALEMWRSLYCRLARVALLDGWSEIPFVGHSGAVSSVCFSPDGRYVLSGSEDASVKLWEIPTGHCVRTFEGHTEAVTAVSMVITENSLLGLSGSKDHTVKVWDVETGQCQYTFQAHASPISAVNFSSDGHYVVSSSWEPANKLHPRGCIMVWETKTGHILRTFAWSPAWVKTACFSPDSRYVLSGNVELDGSLTTGLIKLWDVSTGNCVRTFRGHKQNFINTVCLSSDGRLALSGSGDYTIKLWDVATERCLRTFKGHRGVINAVSLSSDGRYVLSGSSDRTVKLWDVAGMHCLATSQTHTDEVTSVCFSNDGRYALSGSRDNQLRLWSLDWELARYQPENLNQEIQPYLETFLDSHASSAPSASTKNEQPTWTKTDLTQLHNTLRCAGYGSIQPKVLHQLLTRIIASSWQPSRLKAIPKWVSFISIIGSAIPALILTAISLLLWGIVFSIIPALDPSVSRFWVGCVALLPSWGAVKFTRNFIGQIQSHLIHQELDEQPDPLPAWVTQKNNSQLRQPNTLPPEQIENTLKEIDPNWRPELRPGLLLLPSFFIAEAINRPTRSSGGFDTGFDGGDADADFDGDFDGGDTDGGFDGDFGDFGGFDTGGGYDGGGFDSGGGYDGGGGGGSGF